MKRMSVVDGVNVAAGKKAKIGDTYYADFTSALSAATSGATIELIKDASHTTDKTFSDLDALTINGNGNKLEVSAEFKMDKAGADITIKNIELEHSGTKMILRYTAKAFSNTESVFQMDNVKIYSSTSYRWCLFNLLFTGNKLIVDFDDVDIEWDGTNSSAGSIIRAGNDTDSAKTVEIRLDNCGFDTSGCKANNYLFYTTKLATTDITLNNVYMDNNTTYAINCHSDAWDTFNVSCEDIEFASGEQLLNSKVARTEVTDASGNTTYTWYSDFASALTAAEAARGDVILRMYKDAEHNADAKKDSAGKTTHYTINDVTYTVDTDVQATDEEGNLIVDDEGNPVYVTETVTVTDKDITIEGNDFTITTVGSKNAFQLCQKTGSLRFKNVNFDQNSTGIFCVIGAGTAENQASNANLYMDDVVIVADNDTDATTDYQYAVINVLSHGDSTVDMKNVDIKLKVADAGNTPAIVRTGNNGVEHNVTIKMSGCNIDATEATNRVGIAVMRGTDATIGLKDTTIATKNGYTVCYVASNTNYTTTVNAILYGNNNVFTTTETPNQHDTKYDIAALTPVDASTWTETEW